MDRHIRPTTPERACRSTFTGQPIPSLPPDRASPPPWAVVCRRAKRLSRIPRTPSREDRVPSPRASALRGRVPDRGEIRRRHLEVTAVEVSRRSLVAHELLLPRA